MALCVPPFEGKALITRPAAKRMLTFMALYKPYPTGGELLLSDRRHAVNPTMCCFSERHTLSRKRFVTGRRQIGVPAE